MNKNPKIMKFENFRQYFPEENFDIMALDIYNPKEKQYKNGVVIYKKTGETNKYGRKIAVRHKWFEHVGGGKYKDVTSEYQI